jgi:hypothetical protein
MNRRLGKEFRCIMPAAIGALVIPIGIQVCLGHTHFFRNDGIPIFAMFVAFVAASSFGSEWSNSTFTFLLTQPISRTGLWNYKSAVLSATIVSISIAFALSTASPERDWPLLLLPVLCALGLTPWLSLLFRDGLVGAAATLAIEWVILALGFQMFRWRTLTLDERNLGLSGARLASVIAAASLVSLAGWFAGRRALQNWQSVPSRRWADWLSQFEWRGASSSNYLARRGPTMTLLFKELHLQLPNLLLMVFFCLPFVLLIASNTLANDYLIGWFKFYSFVFPTTVAAVAIAREGQLGVLDGQLTLPVSAGRQWTIKIIVCFAICLLGGIFLPWALVCLRTVFHPAANHHWFKVFDYTTEVVNFAALTLLCSAISRGTLRAVILGLSVSFVSLIYFSVIYNLMDENQLVENLWSLIYRSNRLVVNQYTLSAVALVAVVTIIRPAFECFRNPRKAVNIPYLVLRTTVLLTIFRLSLLFVPAAMT